MKWNERDRDIYYDLLTKCDKEILLQRKYTSDCMQKRNEYMVDNSDYVIAVWNCQPSGTGNTVKYAQKSKKRFFLVEPEKLSVEHL